MQKLNKSALDTFLNQRICLTIFEATILELEMKQLIKILAVNFVNN